MTLRSVLIVGCPQPRNDFIFYYDGLIVDNILYFLDQLISSLIGSKWSLSTVAVTSKGRLSPGVL